MGVWLGWGQLALSVCGGERTVANTTSERYSIILLLSYFRALSLSNIYSINLWLLLSPSSLCCDWSLGSVPLVTTLTDSRNVLSLVLYTGLVMLIIHILRSRRDRVPVGMGLMLLLIPFLPSSGLVFRVGFVVAER